jgi:hypothetical protein
MYERAKMFTSALPHRGGIEAQMDTLMFEQIASSITVGSICTRFLGPDLDIGSSLGSAIDVDLGSYPDFDPHFHLFRVVSSEGRLVGVYQYDPGSGGPNAFVGDEMGSIDLHELLSSSTTILDAVDLFAADPKGTFYVVQGNEVVGWLVNGDLFKPIGRIAFLAIALEVEDLALTLCQSKSLCERCWLSISEGRKNKAIALFKDHYKRDPNLEVRPDVERKRSWERSRWLEEISRLIACTQIADKATMLWKLKLIPSTKSADILGHFEKLRRLRDLCAHPGYIGKVPTARNLIELITSAKGMRNSLREAIRNHPDLHKDEVIVIPPAV